MDFDNSVCKEVIITTIRRRGLGTENSPIRVITEIFEKDGTLIAEKDPCDLDSFVRMDLIHFARWVKETQRDIDVLKENKVDEWLESIKTKL